MIDIYHSFDTCLIYSFFIAFTRQKRPNFLAAQTNPLGDLNSSTDLLWGRGVLQKVGGRSQMVADVHGRNGRGHFSILALDRLNKANGVTDFPFRNRLPSSDADSLRAHHHPSQILMPLSFSWIALTAFHLLCFS
ncbi:uncharacterized protein VP01_3g1 [Puccinia sorghi]|uniref:Uncharacterized protein n=1 Tax=Puccinia sorghi TaxID=27349 RepID=A0A0L6UTX0_9BASI|nr:uncharacterized protein VP01_3g1 [Puccinia sorghi]